MTSKNYRAPLIIYFKLCASFRSHWWIQTGVTLRKCAIWVQIGDFLSRVTLKFDGWPWKNNRTLLLCYFKLCASFHSHMWIQTGVRVLWPLTLSSCMDITFVNGNKPWWYDDRNIVKKVWQTDRRTDGRTDRKRCSESCLVAAKIDKTARTVCFQHSD